MEVFYAPILLHIIIYMRIRELSDFMLIGSCRANVQVLRLF